MRAVEVFGNQYGSLHNDEVLSAHGAPGRYLRWQWSGDGVVVVPRRGDLFALVPMYRYPIGRVSLEFPRGGRESGESAESAALRELMEETGLPGASPMVVGRVHAETGLIENGVDVVSTVVPAGAAGRARPEVMESVSEPRWLTRARIGELAARGEITCGVTLAALALVLLV